MAGETIDKLGPTWRVTSAWAVKRLEALRALLEAKRNPTLPDLSDHYRGEMAALKALLALPDEKPRSRGTTVPDKDHY